MIKLQSLNDQEECFELAAAMIEIFRYSQLITIVQTIVPSENLMQRFEVMYYDETTKFERQEKMRRSSRSDHSDFSN